MPLSPHFHVCPALEEEIEALSLSRRMVVVNPFSELTLLQDYPQALESYDDYEEYTFGELRAENTIIEKFGQLLKLPEIIFLVIYLTAL